MANIIYHVEINFSQTDPSNVKFKKNLKKNHDDLKTVTQQSATSTFITANTLHNNPPPSVARFTSCKSPRV